MMWTLRRLALAGSGLTFALIAVAGIVAPQVVAAQYAITPKGVDGLNQFHAIFTGFWLSLTFAMLLAARRPAERTLGNVCGIMIAAQAAGRLLSFVLDGVPTLPFVGATVAEAISALLILLPAWGRTTEGAT